MVFVDDDGVFVCMLFEGKFACKCFICSCGELRSVKDVTAGVINEDSSSRQSANFSRISIGAKREGNS